MTDEVVYDLPGGALLIIYRTALKLLSDPYVYYTMAWVVGPESTPSKRRGLGTPNPPTQEVLRMPRGSDAITSKDPLPESCNHP